MRLALATVGTLLLAAPASSLTIVPVRAIAVQGLVAPGTTSAFQEFDVPTINAAGTVAFSARIGSGTDTLWVDSGGAPTRVATEGDLAPGTGGASYGTLGGGALNDAGQVLFRSRLTGPVSTADDDAAFVGAPGSFALAVREGVTPGLDSFFTTLLGDSGDLLVSDGGIFYGPPGAVTQIFSNDIPGSLGFAGPGDVYFSRNPSSGVGERFFVGAPTAPTQIWQEGDPFGPSLPGVTIRSLNGILSEAGGIFGSTFLGTGVTDDNSFGIVTWSESGGFEMLLREGDAVAGGAGLTLGFADHEQMIVGDGGHAFARANLRNALGATVAALLAGSLTGGLEAAAIVGGAAPGISDAVFAGFGEASNFTDSGLLVFTALIQPALGSAYEALYALRPDGSLVLLLRAGDVIEWQDGQRRTVSNFDLAGRSGFTGAFDSNARALNESGELALEIHHGGRSGIYVMDTAYLIPEPGTAALVGLGLLALGARRRVGR